MTIIITSHKFCEQFCAMRHAAIRSRNIYEIDGLKQNGSKSILFYNKLSCNRDFQMKWFYYKKNTKHNYKCIV